MPAFLRYHHFSPPPFYPRPLPRSAAPSGYRSSGGIKSAVVSPRDWTKPLGAQMDDARYRSTSATATAATAL